ncbi:hypothetical protein BY996DRAFT_355113 [Phakopsora pachyrhizi]|nr:hypothetical protein BY996DRAFT_355113 [Phakopsora pachyrhizi]
MAFAPSGFLTEACSLMIYIAFIVVLSSNYFESVMAMPSIGQSGPLGPPTKSGKICCAVFTKTLVPQKLCSLILKKIYLAFFLVVKSNIFSQSLFDLQQKLIGDKLIVKYLVLFSL